MYRIKTIQALPLLLSVFVVLSLHAGCAGSDETTSKKPIQEYEENFDPSKYKETESREVTREEPVQEALPETETREEFLTIERVEQTMGFRVQVFSTTSFNTAEVRRAEFKELLGDTVAVNIVFDAPYYKLRIGDFLAKAGAEEETTRLKELGINEAWVVRDKVNHIVTEKVLKR